MGDYDRFQSAKSDRLKEMMDNMSSGGWFAGLLKTIGKNFLRKISAVGGLPGMIVGFVGDKILSAGDVKRIGAASLLPKEQRDAWLQSIKDDASGDLTGAFTEGIMADIGSFASQYGMSTKEATEAYWETIRNPKNWGDFLTGSDEFDFLSITPSLSRDPMQGPNLTEADIKLMNKGIPEIELEDIGAGLEDKSILDNLKDLFGEKQGVVDPFDIDEQGFTAGTYQTKGMFGNPVSGGGIQKYVDGDVFTSVNPSDIIDFDIQNPEELQEIYNMIEDLDI